MKTQDNAQPARSIHDAEHALVLVSIVSVFAAAAAVAIIVPQALEIAASHANAARSLPLDAEPRVEAPARAAKRTDPDEPVF